MAIEYKLPFTASEIDAKLNSIDGISAKIEEIKEQIDGGTGGVSSWNDLTDKPFEELPPKFDIAWDGSMDGRFVIDMGDKGMSLVKMSDDVLTLEQMIGATVTAFTCFTTTGESSEEVSEITSDEISGFAPGSVVAGAAVIIYSADDFNTELGFPEGYVTNGVYFMYVEYEGMLGYVSRFVSAAEIKKIDSKFIDMPDVDLSNYVTTSSLDDKLNSYSTTSNVQTMINNAIGNAIGGEY